MKFEAKSPTRVDLAGGTLDCWPLFLLVEQAITVNVSVSIWTRAILEPRESKQILLRIKDLKLERKFDDLDHLLQDKDESFDLIRRQIAFWKPKNGFVLETSSESPIGGGLGGSSSLCISLIKVFSEWLNTKLSLNEIVILAGNIEAQILKKPTGTQDYYGALSHGLNAIHYTAVGPRLEQMPVDVSFLNAQLTLVYTGKPHHSGLNNWQVLRAALDGDSKTIQGLKDLKFVADEVYQVCQRGEWSRLTELFRAEYRARVALSDGFSSPEIRRLEEVVLKAGADAVKICGAGGGGCVLVWSSPERKSGVESACQKAGFEVLDAAVVANQ